MNIKQNQIQAGMFAQIYCRIRKFISWFQSKRNRKDLAAGLLFLLPSITIFAVFVYYALGFNIYLSFTSWNFLAPVKKFIGFTNYERIFTDLRFWKIMLNTTYYAVGTIVISLILGLIFALLLNQKIPGRGLFRTIIFSPYVTTTAAVAVLWIWMFDPSYGLINIGLSWFGIDGPRWLTDVNWAMPALLIMNSWRQSGYAMVIFLGGLTNIPHEYYEAAQLDGANRIKTFFYITLPLLSPTTFFLIVTSLLGAFQVFDQVAVMTQGGPVDATKVINYAIYTEAFVSFRAGYSASISTVLFIILLTVTIFQLRLSKRWVHYQ
jgi:sn-glycerol 3-phosphate transport system permease protein